MSSPKRLAVLTTGRQDWGLLRPLCHALQEDGRFELSLFVGGMANSASFGNTADEIVNCGFDIKAKLIWDVENSSAVSQTADCMNAMSRALKQSQPEAIVVLGDRFETAGAALAAILQNVPVIHLYGGDETEGAFDNSLRHAITKLSHLHLVSHAQHAQRVRQMGEDPEAIHVVGHLSIDNLALEGLPTRAEIEEELGIQLLHPVCLATVHPSTLSDPSEENEADAVAAAIKEIEATWIVTLPNSDPGNEYIRDTFNSLAEVMGNVVAVDALGEVNYFGLMRLCDVVIGNSSSGLTEAPVFGVPTVNVGDRQKGRIRSKSVVDVPSCSALVVSEVRRAISSSILRQNIDQILAKRSGSVSEKIVEILADFDPPNPLRKTFNLFSKIGAQ